VEVEGDFGRDVGMAERYEHPLNARPHPGERPTTAVRRVGERLASHVLRPTIRGVDVDDEREAAVALDFLAELGTAMVRSGEAIDLVYDRLVLVAAAIDLHDVEVLMLPTFIVMQYGPVGARQTRLVTIPRTALRLDQISAVYNLSADVVKGRLDEIEGHRRLDALLAAPAPFHWSIRVLGLGVLSTGFALALQPTPFGLAVAFVLGLMVGLLQLIRLPELKAAMPVIASFLVAAIVFALAEVYDGENPVRALIPPLVVFLPGAMITTGTSELAAGQMVSGSSRLTTGMVSLLLLALGIVSGASLVGADNLQLLDRPPAQLGAWTPWLALVVIMLGNHLYHCAPRRTLPWILLVLVVAYAGQLIGGRLISVEVSGFFGALAMTPVVLAIGRSHLGIPSMVLFLPGFWSLVPGAAGLLDITQLVGTNPSLGLANFISTFVTVISITLGVLLGSAITTAGWRVIAPGHQPINGV
jgi:uncharacterized membrane protein YjjP (DUF1212 family)